MKMINSLFGWTPTCLKASTYNSLCGIAGCALLADSIPQFVGYALVLEAILVSVERCWPENERP